MAHFCPDCKITFENKIPNCPRCGYGIANDAQPESHYLNQGYERFTHQKAITLPDNTQSNNKLDDLRGRYFQFIDPNNQSTSPDAPSRPVSSTPAPSFASEQSQNDTPSNDFFSSFADKKLRTPEFTIETEEEIETIPVPTFVQTPEVPETPGIPNISETTIASETSRTSNYNMPRRRFGGFRISPSQIPWRAIIYFAIFVAVIVIIVTIWNMRFAILNSIVNFFIGIIPTVIIIGVIIYLIRSLFRR